MADEFVTATLTVARSATEIFTVLADPTTHAAIDGTGWVCEALDPDPITSTGQVFRMAMYHDNHPDKNYRMANRVEAFEPPRAISWRPGRTEDGELKFGGWIWRYDLQTVGSSETTITLTYDWSAVPEFIREYLQFPPFGPEHLSNSLHHLADLADAAARAQIAIDDPRRNS